jgi:hypothetical protein
MLGEVIVVCPACFALLGCPVCFVLYADLELEPVAESEPPDNTRATHLESDPPPILRLLDAPER